MIDYLDFHECFIDQTSKGAKINRSDYLEFGDFPIIDQGKALIGGYTNNNSFIFKGEYPCVLFGDHSKEIKYVDFQFCLGADGLKVLKCTNRILPKYGYYFLRTVILPETGYERNFKHLKRIKIPIIDITTQQKIVAVLDKAQKLIRKREQSIQLLDDLLKSTFLEMFGDPVSNNKGWKVAKLNDKKFFKIQGGGTPSKAKPEFYNGHIPWVTPKDMKFDTISDSKIKITELGVSKSSTKLIDSYSTLIVVRSGILKHSFPVGLNIVPVTINQDLKAITPLKTKPYFTFWSIKLHESFVLNKVRAVTADNISFEQLQKIEIILPENQDEFEQIAIKFNSIREKHSLSLIDLENFFQSLLQDAFAGKLLFNEDTVELQTAVEKLNWLEVQAKQITQNSAVAKLQMQIDTIKKLSPSLTAAEYLNQIKKAIPKFQLIDDFQAKLSAKYHITGLHQIKSEVLLRQIQSEKLIRNLTGNQSFSIKSYEEHLEEEERKIREEELKRENDPVIRLISEKDFGKKFQESNNLNLAKTIYDAFGKGEFTIEDLKDILKSKHNIKIKETSIKEGVIEILRDFIQDQFGGLFSFNEMRQKLKNMLFNPHFDLLQEFIDRGLHNDSIEQLFIEDSIEIDGKREYASWLTNSMKMVQIKESRIYLQLKNETH